MSETGLMLFRANSNPDHPHPEIMPDEKIESFSAEGFFKAYHCHHDLTSAEAEASEEHAFNALATPDQDELYAAFKRGRAHPYHVVIHDDGSVDVFSRVVIHDDGSVDAFNPETDKLACHYSMTEFTGLCDMEPYADETPEPT